MSVRLISSLLAFTILNILLTRTDALGLRHSAPPKPHRMNKADAARVVQEERLRVQAERVAEVMRVAKESFASVYKSSQEEIKNVGPAGFGTVPKIVHLMFKGKGFQKRRITNSIWNTSLAMWNKHFPEPEYTYKFWDDDSLAEQFKTNCPSHFKLYQSFVYTISRADMSRYCLLHTEGGIYTDLDYEPRSNFYEDLVPGKVSLIESPYATEFYQNSLMASPAGHPFWKVVMEKAELRQLTLGQSHVSDPVLVSGPRLLDAVIEDGEDMGVVNKLPCSEYQRQLHAQALTNQTSRPGCELLTAENVGTAKGIHWSTWSWTGSKKYSRMGKGTVANPDTVDIFNIIHPETYKADLVLPDH